MEHHLQSKLTQWHKTRENGGMQTLLKNRRIVFLGINKLLIFPGCPLLQLSYLKYSLIRRFLKLSLSSAKCTHAQKATWHFRRLLKSYRLSLPFCCFQDTAQFYGDGCTGLQKKMSQRKLFSLPCLGTVLKS